MALRDKIAGDTRSKDLKNIEMEKGDSFWEFPFTRLPMCDSDMLNLRISKHVFDFTRYCFICGKLKFSFGMSACFETLRLSLVSCSFCCHVNKSSIIVT